MEFIQRDSAVLEARIAQASEELRGINETVKNLRSEGKNLDDKLISVRKEMDAAVRYRNVAEARVEGLAVRAENKDIDISNLAAALRSMIDSVASHKQQKVAQPSNRVDDLAKI